MCMPNNEISKIALVLDVRTDQPFDDAIKILSHLKKKGYKYEILFMDASENVLIKRYKESRRIHPLALDDRAIDGIQREKVILQDMKKQAEYSIDTASLLTRDLKE